ncbi:hypothetical protein BB560_004795 [Smittium megazygosporum]|uniref:Mitochondrial carrier protein n=1 Tax=Smittium megazygosporum TaxID=133381 RepID=A0A2T9Z8A8_9FUNG|nr:hypothetical protein BB560_004795 [Smittium megazygosporum]
MNKEVNPGNVMPKENKAVTLDKLAGFMAGFASGATKLIVGHPFGWTVALVATPVELLKMRLQTQYNAYGSNESRVYSSAYDCAKKIVQANGIRGLWYGLPATMIQRSFFFFLWGSYDIYSNWLRSFRVNNTFPYFHKASLDSNNNYIIPENEKISEKLVSFIAGGWSATTFWTLVFPFDVVKNRYMAYGAPKYPSIPKTISYIFKTEGIPGFFKGFVPSFIRSFPTNACAVFVWDTTMRLMVGHGHN